MQIITIGKTRIDGKLVVSACGLTISLEDATRVNLSHSDAKIDDKIYDIKYGTKHMGDECCKELEKRKKQSYNQKNNKKNNNKNQNNNKNLNTQEKESGSSVQNTKEG